MSGLKGISCADRSLDENTVFVLSLFQFQNEILNTIFFLPSLCVALPNEHIRHFFLGGSPLGWGRRRVGKRRPRPLSLQGQLSCHFPLDNNKPDYSKGSDWWCDDGWRNLVVGVWRWWFWVYSHFHCFTFWLPVMNNKQHTKFNNVYSCAVCSISMPILIKPHQAKSIHI